MHPTIGFSTPFLGSVLHCHLLNEPHPGTHITCSARRVGYWGNDLSSDAKRAENLEAYKALVDNGVSLIDTAEVRGRRIICLRHVHIMVMLHAHLRICIATARRARAFLEPRQRSFTVHWQVYGFGFSEEFIGGFMRQTGTSPAIATKFAPLPWRFSSDSVVDACK